MEPKGKGELETETRVLPAFCLFPSLCVHLLSFPFEDQLLWLLQAAWQGITSPSAPELLGVHGPLLVPSQCQILREGTCIDLPWVRRLSWTTVVVKLGILTAILGLHRLGNTGGCLQRGLCLVIDTAGKVTHTAYYNEIIVYVLYILLSFRSSLQPYKLCINVSNILV